MECGLREAERGSSPEFLLLTDADVVHHSANVGRLVAKADTEGLDLVSLMVMLAGSRGLAALLIPAFVYFFQLLYPFRWASDPRARTAAAAGGCVLVRRERLREAGGLEAISGAVIDDCALARLVKDAGGAIWIGLTRATISIRRYERLGDVWTMVTRTAFAQLRYSALLLLATLAGMLVLFVGPVAAVCAAPLDPPAAVVGGLAGGLMALTCAPSLRLYRRTRILAPLLPVAAALFLAMTVHSALRHWPGRRVRWRGRELPRP
jgi:hopene-associated glycosyltransferase HpnB